jgi:hypothetical protein
MKAFEVMRTVNEKGQLLTTTCVILSNKKFLKTTYIQYPRSLF